MRRIDKNLIIYDTELDNLYAKLNNYRKLINRELIHLKNLRHGLYQTENNKKHKNNKTYHLNRIKDEISSAEMEKNRLETLFTKTQKEIFEQETIVEERKLLLNKENLEVEQLLSLEYVKRLKQNEEMNNYKEYDVFISHSSEDKESFVRPLAEELKKLEVAVWYDDFELKIGDSLREKIDFGLSNSKFGIVVLSNSFFKRKWTKYELNGFISREMNESKVILPIWHKVSKDEVICFSPTLADKVALNSSTKSIKEIAIEIKSILK
jgi:hypothetical protein